MYEILFCPTETSASLSLDDLKKALHKAGLPCESEEDDDNIWLIFDSLESSICLLGDAKSLNSGLIQIDSSDNPEFIVPLTQVIKGLGWQAGDDEGPL